jgi:hypothetical protein
MTATTASEALADDLAWILDEELLDALSLLSHSGVISWVQDPRTSSLWAFVVTGTTDVVLAYFDQIKQVALDDGLIWDMVAELDEWVDLVKGQG